MYFITIRNITIFVINMNNTRFATIIHILTILATKMGEWINSEWIAGSINTNPVIVRKELSILQEQGWVTSRKGKDGGFMLNVSNDKITLAELYKVVKNSDVLGKKNLNPSSKCPIGKDINKNLETLFTETDELVIASLQTKTLKSFMEQF